MDLIPGASSSLLETEGKEVRKCGCRARIISRPPPIISYFSYFWVDFCVNPNRHFGTCEQMPTEWCTHTLSPLRVTVGSFNSSAFGFAPNAIVSRRDWLHFTRKCAIAAARNSKWRNVHDEHICSGRIITGTRSRSAAHRRTGFKFNYYFLPQLNLNLIRLPSPAPYSLACTLEGIRFTPRAVRVWNVDWGSDFRKPNCQ